MDYVKKGDLSIAIIIVSVILGGFYCIGESMKQKSIERQINKEYIAERKMDCYNIERMEREIWNGMNDICYNVDDGCYKVESGYYYESGDVCEIKYINLKWQEGDPNSCSDPGSFGFFRSIDEEESCTIKKYFKREF